MNSVPWRPPLSKGKIWHVLVPRSLFDSHSESQRCSSLGHLRKWNVRMWFDTMHVKKFKSYSIVPLIPCECDRTQDKITMSHSDPWKPSTVATLTFRIELFTSGIFASCSVRSCTYRIRTKDKSKEHSDERCIAIVQTMHFDSPDLCKMKLCRY